MAKRVNRQAEDVKFEEVNSEKSSGSQTINAEKLKDKNEKINVDFMSEETDPNDFVRRPTREGDEKKREDESDRSQEELKDELKNEESRNFTEKDFRLFAGFIISALDVGVSTFCKYFAGDTSDTAYSISNSKKDLLTHQMTLILVKYFKYIRIELLFAFSLCMCYSGAIVKARAFRKARKNYEREGERRKQERRENREQKQEDSTIQDAEIITEEPAEQEEESRSFRKPAGSVGRRPANHPGKA